jgi:tripartite-type tricarboxylate transporter receptor subunit TctC
MFTDIAAALGLLKAGSLRPIAVTSLQRSALMPDLPTIAESGVPDYDLSGWISLYAPAGTPKATVERLNAEVTKVLQHPEVRARLLDLGAEPSPMPVAEFTAWTQQEVNKWTKLVREAGIQPE